MDMNKCIKTFLLIILFAKPLFSQIKEENNEEVVIVHKEFYKNSSIFLDEKSEITSFTISANIEFLSNNGAIKILLVDTDDLYYLVYEDISLVKSSKTLFLRKYAEETEIMNMIHPQKMIVELHDCILSLDTIFYSTSKNHKWSDISRMQDSIKLIKETQKIEEINEWLIKHDKKWTAKISDMAMSYYNDVRDICPLADASLLYLFRRYGSGVFEICYAEDTSGYTSTGTYVANRDYRDFHGQNWITSVKDQRSCGSCAIFSLIATTESLFNLHNNRLWDLDLSEQELISCNPMGNCRSGWSPFNTSNYIRNNGIVEETLFSYGNSDTISCIASLQNMIPRYYISDFEDYGIISSTQYIDTLQKLLVQYGPISSGIDSLTHAMSLVGYYTDSTDSSIIWIFKNSWGNTWGENGFVNIKTPITHIHWSVLLKGPYSSDSLYEQSSVCVDMDGDGYYNWGIGTKPATCPDCAPDTPDGNDADPSIGPVNEYGQPILPFTPLTIPDTEVTTSQTWSNNRTICGDLIIKNNATLTLTGTISMQASHRIYVKSGAKLIINGGKTSLAGITVESGGTLTLNGNGTIEIFNPADVIITIGGLFNHNYGKINVVNPFLPN
ncbi:MAG: hypothetical protein II926_10100 [Bacteroidales bacterium]|nr:hypothetical protein [Bacteroidales bacterium]